MRLIDRYVLRELAVPFCIGIAVGVLLLIGTLLFQFADLIINKGIPVILVVKLLVLKVPSFTVIAMPMAMAFAASLAVNRLARDSEVTAMRMAGLPFRRIVRVLFVAGVLGSALSYVMAEKASPWANAQANLIIRQMWLQSVAPTAQPNVFIHAENYTFYIAWLNKLDSNQFLLKDVLVYDTTRPGYPAWYVAKKAYTTRRRWTLYDVVRRDIGRNGMTVHETYLPRLPIDLEKDVSFIAGSKTSDEMTGDELMQQIRMLTTSGAGNIARSFAVDYHFRFALPLACLVFGLVSAPVSFHFSRGGTFVGVLVSIVIGFMYWNVMILSKVLGANGVLPPIAAAWTQNILFGVVAGYLVWRTG